MKNLLVVALTAVMLVGSAIAPKRAQAVEPGTVVTGVLIVSAVGLGIWTIYELVVVGDELSASTSEFSGQVYNKKEYLEKVQDDAFEFIAGEAPSAILMESLKEARKHLDEDHQDVSDIELAKAAVKFTEAELNR